jgi:hypothetical protein
MTICLHQLPVNVERKYIRYFVQHTLSRLESLLSVSKTLIQLIIISLLELQFAKVRHIYRLWIPIIFYITFIAYSFVVPYMYII